MNFPIVSQQQLNNNMAYAAPMSPSMLFSDDSDDSFDANEEVKAVSPRLVLNAECNEFIPSSSSSSSSLAIGRKSIKPTSLSAIVECEEEFKLL